MNQSVGAPRQPSIKGYLVAVGLVVVAFVGSIAWFVLGLMNLSDTMKGFDRAPVPGATALEIDETGTWTVFLENGADLSESLRVSVRDPRGEPLELVNAHTDVTYGFGGHEGTSGATFEAEETGTYTMTVLGEARQGATVAVGKGFGGSIAGAIAGPVLLWGACMLAALVLTIVTVVRRSKARKAVAAHWAQQQAAWQASAQQPIR